MNQIIKFFFNIGIHHSFHWMNLLLLLLNHQRRSLTIFLGSLWNWPLWYHLRHQLYEETSFLLFAQSKNAAIPYHDQKGTKMQLKKLTVRLYCHCRRPQGKDEMILCEVCNEWFHFNCEKVKKRKIFAKAVWKCSNCQNL